MNRIKLITFMIVICIYGQSQNELKIGLNLSPNATILESGVRNITRIGSSFGISGDYYLTKRITIRSGLDYNRIAFLIKNVEDSSNLVDEDGNICHSCVQRFTMYMFKYFTRIPLNFNYYFSEKIYASYGFELVYFNHDRTRRQYIDRSVITRYKLNDLQYGINLGFGFEFSKKNIFLQIEPRYTYLKDQFGHHNLIQLGFFIKRRITMHNSGEQS